MTSPATTWIAVSTVCVFAAVTLISREIGPLWDRTSRRVIADLIPTMRDLGMDDRQVDKLMRWWGLSLLAVVIGVGILLGMPPVAFGMLYLLLLMPRMYLDYRIDQRRRRLRDQLVRGATALANTSRAGMSLIQGIETVADETPEPLGTELQRLVREYRAGRPIADVLRETQRRLSIESFTLFSSALLICLERGGKADACA